MKISERLKSDFIELFLQNCGTRNAISVLRVIPILRQIGARSDVTARRIWMICDLEAKGHINMGYFICACILAKAALHLSQIPKSLPEEFETILTIESPIPLHDTNALDAQELQSENPLECLMAKEALAAFQDEFIPVQVASTTVVGMLSLNEWCHDMIRLSCPLPCIMSRLKGECGLQTQHWAAVILCCLSSTNPNWIATVLSGLVQHLITYPSDVQHLIMGAVANGVCGQAGICEAWVEDPLNDDTKSVSAGVLNQIRHTKDPRTATEALRFFLNAVSLHAKGRFIISRLRFFEVIARDGGNLLKILSPSGCAYLVDIMRLLAEQPGMRFEIVKESRLVGMLFQHLDPSTLFDKHVAPKIMVLLLKLSHHAELHSDLLNQDVLKLVVSIYDRLGLDEVVRITCMKVLLHLLGSAESVDMAFETGCLRVVQNACEKETHIEIISSALDVWKKLCQDPDVNSASPPGYTVTVASFLWSDSMEMRAKAFSILAQLLEHPIHAFAFVGLSPDGESDRPQEEYLKCLLKTLAGDAPLAIVRDATECLFMLSNITDHRVVDLLESLKVSNQVFALLADGAPRNKTSVRQRLIETIASLSLGGSHIRKRLVLEIPGFLDLVVMQSPRSQPCQEGTLGLVADFNLTAVMSKYIPFIYAHVQKEDPPIILVKILSLYSIRCTHPQVRKQLEEIDVVGFWFRFLRCGCTEIVRLSLIALGSLRQIALHQIASPSRIFNLSSLLGELSDDYTRRAILNILACITVSMSSGPRLVLDSIGMGSKDLSDILTTNLIELDLEKLTLLTFLAKHQRFGRELAARSELCTFLFKSVRNDMDSFLALAEVRRSSASADDVLLRKLCILSLVSTIVSIKVLTGIKLDSDLTTLVRADLPRHIFHSIDLDVIGRLKLSSDASSPVAGDATILLLNVLRTFFDRRRGESVAPFQCTLSSFQNRVLKFWNSACMSLRASGRTSVFDSFISLLSSIATAYPQGISRIPTRQLEDFYECGVAPHLIEPILAAFKSIRTPTRT